MHASFMQQHNQIKIVHACRSIASKFIGLHTAHHLNIEHALYAKAWKQSWRGKKKKKKLYVYV